MSVEAIPQQENEVHVLIIGAGPAGYMAALWLARLGVNTRIIDKRSSRIFTGQADGLQPRVLEVFETFGFADRAMKEVAIGFEACYYDPDENGNIRRVETVPEGIPGISRFNGSVIHQGRIEKWLTDAITEFSGGKCKVERPVQPESLEIDPNAGEYPVRVILKKLHDELAMPEQFGHTVQNGLYRQFEGDQETTLSLLPGDGLEVVRAKYVLGCDGAHSWVRKQLGIEHEGETTDFVWGVLDMVPVTDFPDIRKRCSIHSKNNGNIMIIPRENQIVRLYIQLRELAQHDKMGGDNASEDHGETKARGVDRSKVTAEQILDSAKKILHPYTLDAAAIHWFTAYQIGQRVATAFEKQERVFIAGDACHTHSPKAGQGMNVSMMDTFNLAWKIAYVVKGFAYPSILSTYEFERRTVAQDLIAYDHKLTRLFSSKPGEISTQEFRRVIEQGTAFTTGCTVNYYQSILTDKPANQSRKVPYHNPLANQLAIGMRIPDVKLIMESDGRPWFFNQRLLSTGQFRVLVFIGDYARAANLKRQMYEIGEYLGSSNSFTKRLGPLWDSTMELLLIHASQQADVEWDDFPSVFRRRDEHGVMDYWKVLADRSCFHDETGHAYEKYGIDTKVGAIVALRPDGYVAKVVEPTLAGIREVGDWFSRFLVLSPSPVKASI
ncbi:hypothetical protein N7491_009178 [Penicillium cf. griseofulvum]|uniref:FAD-binding domain-containing protein n=1 Tax=Penicillium cf. griseofulvum TaxID=2972120 RepID=A0A9W9JN20_9EURO|nr:hypothetical protein N7472_005227 [Penicillium cf. griseofulvum]KAJ5423962.1 hypothetical protein N7491_009178 [Penicillium cf. griseofulvum]